MTYGLALLALAAVGGFAARRFVARRSGDQRAGLKPGPGNRTADPVLRLRGECMHGIARGLTCPKCEAAKGGEA